MRPVRDLLVFVICFISIIGTVVNSHALQPHFSLQWNATFAPPHNEPIIGNRVARYRLQVEPTVKFGWLRYRLMINAWGVNRWQQGCVVGDGMSAWENSDWSVERWRFSFLQRAEIGPKLFHVFVEDYQPIHARSWGGHGMETDHYLLVGIGGILW